MVSPESIIANGATGAPRLNAQSPSELSWRLRFEADHINGFDITTVLGHTIRRHAQSRYQGTYPPSLDSSLMAFQISLRSADLPRAKVANGGPSLGDKRKGIDGTIRTANGAG